MDEISNLHLTPKEFEEKGKQVLSWLRRYYERIENYRVAPDIKPGEIRAKLPANPPMKGEDFSNILKDLDEIIVPGLMHWQSPYFFGFFPANISAPSVLAELVSAGLGIQGMLWATSPACTELETHVLDWVADILHLPEQFKSTAQGGGVIQDSASSAALCAIISARERITGYESNLHGCSGKLVAYASTQTHSSIEKGIKIAGIGNRNLRLIGVDDKFAIRPELLEEEIKRDISAGLIPFFVCATVGTTSSCAFDSLNEIGKICQKYKLWLHIDAAMAGTAAICPEYRHILDGIEYADSFCFNPHKWMFTNFDCDCFFVADRHSLIRSLTIMPEYLKNQASSAGTVIDYRDWQIPLGRRFRALKLWFVIRHYGVEGLQTIVRNHIALAKEFASWIKESNELELAAPQSLNLVCFRHKGGDKFSEQLLNDINHSGKIFLSHTKLNERFVIRMCIGQTYTEKRHVELAWNIIKEYAQKITV
ncbi:MAG TPA: pyridoxal-dependent decarboxylase [Verrucomicrobiota bacterium]|nr:pyridoxal-dependent decarboxylase [Verrucomicrobiota bacterium]